MYFQNELAAGVIPSGMGGVSGAGTPALAKGNTKPCKRALKRLKRALEDLEEIQAQATAEANSDGVVSAETESLYIAASNEVSRAAYEVTVLCA